jgi:hypothetical protein
MMQKHEPMNRRDRASQDTPKRQKKVAQFSESKHWVLEEKKSFNPDQKNG